MTDRGGMRRSRSVALLLAGLTLVGCSSSREADASTASAASAPPGWSAPPVNAVVDYQIGGAYQPARAVQVVIRDRRNSPAPGKFSVCYVNAFQTQPEDAPFWTGAHPDLLLHDASGDLVEDENWPGEYLLDTRTPVRRAGIAKILNAWVDGCAAKGFRAVDPDNLDTYDRSGGLLRATDNLALIKLVAAHTHAKGLSIGQKNASDLGAAGRRAGLDFVVAESCQVYDECDAYTAVFGRHVIEIEYTTEGRAGYAAACRARGKRISVIYRDPTVQPRGSRSFLSETC